MALFSLSPNSLARKWAQLERVEALDAERFDDAMKPEISRRATLLGKAGIEPASVRAFARACVLRARSHAVSALSAADMELGALGASDEPANVTGSCEVLMARVRARGEEARARAADLYERQERARPLLPVGPVEEQTAESLTQWAISVGENVMGLHDLAPASDEAMLFGSTYQTLRLTVIAARSSEDSPDVATAWVAGAAQVRAANAALATAAAGLQATAAAFYADPPTSPMTRRATFADFAEGARLELKWQANWLRSHAARP